MADYGSFSTGGQVYHPPDYSGLFQGVNAAIARYQAMQQENDKYDSVMSTLAQTPDPMDPSGKRMMITPRQMQSYQALSGAHKAAAAQGQLEALNLHQQLTNSAQENMLRQQQILASQQSVKASQEDIAGKQAERRPPTAEEQTQAEQLGGKIIFKDGKYTFQKYETGGDDQPINIDPLIDPSTKKAVPGYGVNRKTGAVVPTTPESVRAQQGVTLDPSGKFYFDGKNWKAVPGPTMVLPGLSQGGQPGAQPQQPQSTFNVTGNQGTVPAPSPAPSSAVGPQAGGAQGGPSAGAQSLANEIKRRFNLPAGHPDKLSLDEAKQLLGPLGYGSGQAQGPQVGGPPPDLGTGYSNPSP